MKEIIQKLTEISAPSGRERVVHNAILEELDGYIDGFRFDPVGNLIVWKNGSATDRKKILLDAHADEIGLVITRIDDKGFLRVDPVGGLDPVRLLGARVCWGNRIGIIDVEQETIADYRKNIKELNYDLIYADIGCNSREEALQHVHVGQFGTYCAPFVDLGERMVAKSMDDRIGCAIIVQVFKEIGESVNDLYGVFAVQEEVGLVGSQVAGFDIHPDIAIALDVTGCSDTPKGFKRMDLALGKGPAIKVKDRASISDEKVVDLLVQTADDHHIPYQMEVLIFGGTDAYGYQITGSGIKAGTLSIVTRYVHSPNEMVDYSDVLHAVQLLKCACNKNL